MHRWSNLACHGLLSTSLIGAASAPAIAEPCGDASDAVVGFTIGVDFAPKAALTGGLELRRCLADSAEAMLRLEFGGGGIRLLGGARARLFEKNGNEDDWGDRVGFEAGLGVELYGDPGAVGGHLAATYGSELIYLALEGLLPIADDKRSNRGSLVFGISPLLLGTGPTPGRPVPGRAFTDDGYVLPDVLARAGARSMEDRVVRDHFTYAAQLEYSSVWTFLRLAAELAAVGAPTTLVARALDAADDEVRHAELCARAAGGLALAPLSMLAAQPRFTRRSTRALATIANEAWREGCLNEGIAAEEARLAAADAQRPARSMLEAIARDEAGHADLAWDVLAWVHLVAPEVARVAIVEPEAFRHAISVEDPALARRGVASSAVRRAAVADTQRRAIERVRTVTDV
ncbi:MAG: hypothetical protein AB7T06_16940 [Kofleriaceae bacterium]